ncbi:MAG: 50S ribosomal protein L10 [Candidatus Rokubacteria bacterium]|nr:50S ribosomal protein L10 [Candidatus Rokubacteria bacterium]MBI3825480.1 50S ribosomal protein L10 [Candidatus Rokubacteria bacterium]
MPTQEKVEAVEELKGQLAGVKTVVLTEYRGLTVAQLSELRRQLRQVSAQYTVVKNRLARIAVRSTELEALGPHLKGPTGMVVSAEDPVAVAKTLQTFVRTNQALAIKAGMVDGRVLDTNGLKALADLPSKDALRAQIVGLVQGPLAQLVGLLQAPPRELAYILAERGRAAAAEATAD